MSSLEPRIPSIPTSDGDAAIARLQQLSFGNGTEIREALSFGAAAFRASGGPNYPKSYPGIRMWGETSAQLVTSLAPIGWEPADIIGLRLAHLPSANRVLLVVAGTAETGKAGYVPQARYRRGEVSIHLVNDNQGVIWGDQVGGNPVWDVWCLLHHVGTLGVSAEVSKPGGVSAGGLITSWSERILLPFFGFEPYTGSRVPAPAPEPVLPIIERRVG